MSNRTEGHDTAGRPVHIGDTDSDGKIVGWIHPDTGLAYESEGEYWDCAITGRYTDAFNEAWREGRPDPSILPFLKMAPAPHAERVHDALMGARWLARIARNRRPTR